jgi:diguanylate cyclase (GGDEF)-like protein
MRSLRVGVLVAVALVCPFAFPARAAQVDPTFRLMTSHSTVVNVEGAGSQNFAIEEDERGIIYIGNLGGVVEYDGEWWRLIKLPNDNSAYVIEALPGGRVATGGWNEVGYLEPDARGAMTYHSLNPRFPEPYRETGELGAIFPTSEGVAFLTTKVLAMWSDAGIEILTEIDFEKDFWRGFRVGDEIWLATKSGLKRLSGRRVEDLPGGGLYADRKVRMITRWDDGRSLVWVRDEGLYLFDGQREEPFAKELWDRLKASFPFEGLRLRDGRLAIVTMNGGVMILDADGRVDEMIDSSTGLPDADIVGAHLSSDGSLWLVMDNNVTRVDTASPVTIVDPRGGLRGTPVAIVRHGGALHVGTTSGLFRIVPSGLRWDSSDRRVARPLGRDVHSAWSLLSVGDELLAGTSSGIHVFRGQESSGIVDGTEDETAYCLVRSESNPDRIWVGTTLGFGTLERSGGKWVWNGRMEGIPNSVRSVVEASPEELWLGTSFDGLLHVRLKEGSAPEVERFGESEVTVYRIGGRLVMTSDEPHVLMLDNGKLVPDAVLGPMGNGTNLFVAAEDGDGNVWLNTKPPGVGLRQPDGSFVFDDRMLLGMPGKDVQSIYPDQTGVVWFGTDQGLVKFDAFASWTVTEPRRPIIHRITVGGRPVEQAGPLEIRHDAGRLRFEVAGISFDSGVQYHFRLTPVEADWSPWTTEPVTEYTNLWEGDYTFHVQSRSARGEESPELTFTFRVLPPWYRTSAAWIAWVVLALGIVIGIPVLRHRALKQRALELEKKVAEQTVELTQAVAKLEFANNALAVMSRIDPLTDIPNRRQFDEKHEEEWSRARRMKVPVGLIIIDLDHFKSLNDSQGHYAGDVALKKIGNYLHGNMRRTGDLVARLGGEEFAVIMPNTAIEGCRHRAEQLREGVEALEIAHDGSPSGVLTASFGIASLVPGAEQSHADLMIEADKALYKAKAAGRNCVRAGTDPA